MLVCRKYLAAAIVLFPSLGGVFGVQAQEVEQTQTAEREGFVGAGIYGDGYENSFSMIFNIPVADRFSFEGAVADYFDYFVRANGYYHVNNRFRIGAGAVSLKASGFEDSGARFSAGYSVIQDRNFNVDVLVGKEFILNEGVFVELQAHYKFNERFSVYYHGQSNSGGRRGETTIGLAYRF